jgi:hypothetical protein
MLGSACDPYITFPRDSRRLALRYLDSPWSCKRARPGSFAVPGLLGGPHCAHEALVRSAIFNAGSDVLVGRVISSALRSDCIRFIRLPRECHLFAMAAQRADIKSTSSCPVLLIWGFTGEFRASLR